MREVFKDADNSMKESVAHFKNEIAKIRTGRASIAIFDGVRVDYYGVPTPIKQVATLTVVDANLIQIQPWDKSLIKSIEKAIIESDLGLNPSNDGKVIRVPIPPLTEERRKKFVKLVHELAEKARNAIRHFRREAIEKLKKKEKNKEISEDDLFRGKDEIQKIHDKYIAQINELLEKKEKELQEV